MPNGNAPRVDVSLEPQLPRVHKGALALAVGLTAGIAVFLITASMVLLRLEGPLELLNQYFYGYALTWTGALVGMAWGGAAGCVAGWLLGFVHNFTVDIWAILMRAKHEPTHASDLLDNI